jgi:hypothetical protein
MLSIRDASAARHDLLGVPPSHLLLTADPGHGERFLPEGAGALDYSKNRRS